MLTLAQTAQVDLSHHFATARVDAHDDVLIPNIGIHFTLDVFQLVELFYWLPCLANLDRARGLQGLRVQEIQCGAAIRKDQAATIGSQSPTFCGVGKGGLKREIFIVDKAGVFFPGELIELVLVER